ncbi:unnamed protein product, partial [Phaeothamnion confervicola]
MMPASAPVPPRLRDEPAMAGLYFRLYNREPGFTLQPDLVECFVACAADLLSATGDGAANGGGGIFARYASDYASYAGAYGGGPPDGELLAELLQALYTALASLPADAAASVSRRAVPLWRMLVLLAL